MPQFIASTSFSGEYLTKAGNFLSPEAFYSKLRNIQLAQPHVIARNGEAMAQCLGKAFEYIHCLQFARYDTTGHGFFLAMHDPAMICTVTTDGYMDSLNLPGLKVAGCELYREPFRWNHRIFSLVLVDSESDHDQILHSPKNVAFWIDKMVAVTNGCNLFASDITQIRFGLESWVSTSSSNRNSDDLPPDSIMHRQLSSPAYTPIFPSGVIVSFAAAVSSQSNSSEDSIPISPHLCVLQCEPIDPVFIQKLLPKASRGNWYHILPDFCKYVGFWPIPEVQSSIDKIEPRPWSQPRLLVHHGQGIDWASHIPEGMMFKKYLINPNSEIAKFIMRVENRMLVWPVSMASHPPFAFLKLNSAENGVNLWILPYNFPELFSLIEQWKTPSRVDSEWKRRFELYFKTLPFYYQPYMRRVMKGVKCQPLFPLPAESQNHQPTANVLKHWKKMREYALGYETKFNSRPSTPLAEIGNLQDFNPLVSNAFDLSRSKLIEQHYTRMKILHDIRVPVDQSVIAQPIDIFDASLFSKSVTDIVKSWRIPRIASTRTLLGPRNDMQKRADDIHAVPISKMTDYKGKLTKLRFLNEEDEIRDKMLAFGNPYKRITLPGNQLEKKDQLEDEEVKMEEEQFYSENIPLVSNISHSKHDKEIRKKKKEYESISEKRETTLKLGLNLIRMPFDPELIRSEEARKKLVSDLHAKIFEKQMSQLTMTPQTTSFEKSSAKRSEIDDFSPSVKRRKTTGDNSLHSSHTLPSPSKKPSNAWIDLAVSESLISGNENYGSTTPVHPTDQQSEVSEFSINIEMDEDEPAVSPSPPAELDDDNPSTAASTPIKLQAPPPDLQSLKKQLSSLVKKPGTSSNAEVIALLGRNDLDRDARVKLVSIAIQEAKRFKKNLLLKQLEAMNLL